MSGTSSPQANRKASVVDPQPARKASVIDPEPKQPYDGPIKLVGRKHSVINPMKQKFILSAELAAGTMARLFAVTNETPEDHPHLFLMVARLQRMVRRALDRSRLQSKVVAVQLAKRRAARVLIDEHRVDGPEIDICKDLSQWTLETFNSAFTSQQQHRKPATVRNLGSAAQLLLAALEGVGTLGGHQTYAGFITALHVFLADVFGATAVYVCRIIKVATANGESRAFVVGNADP